MISFLIFMALFIAAIAWASRTIARDSYGERPGPRSHHDETSYGHRPLI